MLKTTWEFPSIDTARAKITQILSNWRPPTPNLTEEEFKSLKHHQQDKTITILKSDKGNATVVMDKNDYEEKMLMLLADNKTYERIDSKVNPLKSIEKELNKLLWQLVKEEKIISLVYSTLKCIKRVTPKIYGLPKVHSVNLPLRPIVAFVGSPTYNLSKFLINVLSPLLKQTYSVKTSAQFVNIVNDLRCKNLHCFVSFDVVSLFTSIPTSDVLNLIFRLLNRDNSLRDRTNLSVNDIIEALIICQNPPFFLSKMFCIVKFLMYPWSHASRLY